MEHFPEMCPWGGLVLLLRKHGLRWFLLARLVKIQKETLQFISRWSGFLNTLGQLPPAGIRFRSFGGQPEVVQCVDPVSLFLDLYLPVGDTGVLHQVCAGLLTVPTMEAQGQHCEHLTCFDLAPVLVFTCLPAAPRVLRCLWICCCSLYFFF